MSSEPTFSVVIPTYNRPEPLRACLESFCSLDYPRHRWELVVVNDGGERSLTAVSEALKRSLPLTLLTVPHGGPASARNAGAKRAKFDYLAFTDDDCRVFPNWLTQFASGFSDGAYAALGGRSLTPFEQNSAERAWQHLTDFLYDFMKDDAGNNLLLISNNVAYRRAIFEQIGGFNETFPLAAAEDMEISYRLLKHGYRQRYFPSANVWHYHHLTTWGHIRQQFRYGRGGYYFNLMREQNIDDPLMALYFRRWFYSALERSFIEKQLPPASERIVRAAQLAYRFGMRYQTMRHRFDAV